MATPPSEQSPEGSNTLHDQKYLPVDLELPVRAPAFDPEKPARSPLTNLLITVFVWLVLSIVLPLIPYQPKQLNPMAASPFEIEMLRHLPIHVTLYIVQHIPLSPEYYYRMTVFHFLPSLPFLILQIMIGFRIVKMNWQPKTSMLIVLASVLSWIVLRPVELYSVIHHGKLATLLLHATPLVFNLALTLAFSCIGSILSRIVREANVLLPVSIIAMPIDYVGAMTTVGFTNTMIQKHPQIVSQVMIHVPHLSSLAPESMIGPGDILFIAFFLAAIDRLSMNVRGTLILFYVLLSLTLLLVVDTGIAVAALVPMGIAVIAANFRYFKLKRDEVFAMAYATVVVFCLVGAFYVISHKVIAK